MGKAGRTISFDSYILSEFDKRTIDLNELINELLAEKLVYIQIKEEMELKKKQAEQPKETLDEFK